MFPLYDENPTRTTPYLTYGLIGANVLVFLHEIGLSNLQLEHFFSIVCGHTPRINHQLVWRMDNLIYLTIPTWRLVAPNIKYGLSVGIW